MSSKSEGNLKVKGGGGGVVSGFSDADCSCKKRAKNGNTWISNPLSVFVYIVIFPLVKFVRTKAMFSKFIVELRLSMVNSESSRNLYSGLLTTFTLS